MTVALACSGHENDYIPNGVMEYTTDGSSWTAFETQPAAGSTTDVTLELAEAKEIKGFRWKNSNNDKNRWLIIREISCDAFEKKLATAKQQITNILEPSAIRADGLCISPEVIRCPM